MEFPPMTEKEKRELVTECRQLWGEEIAGLMEEDLGLKPKPPSDGETKH